MTKVVALHPAIASAGDNALEFMDTWKSDMVPSSKAVIIYSDATGAYSTYAVNCSMTEALGFVVVANDQLLHQVRPRND